MCPAEARSYHEGGSGATGLASARVLGESPRMIKIGDTLPEATLYETLEFGEACPVSPKPVKASEASGGKRVVIFGLPGAYTATCSAKHLPGYVAKIDALKAKGVDEVWCVSVNDGYVMAAWGREHDAIGKVRMLGDGNAELTKALGLERDLSGSGMGVRAQRFSLLVDRGVVRQVNVEASGKFEVSDADTMLRQLG
jgi:peroxiredoxin